MGSTGTGIPVFLLLNLLCSEINMGSPITGQESHPQRSGWLLPLGLTLITLCKVNSSAESIKTTYV